MNSEPTDAQLRAFLEEQLPVAEATALEHRLRNDAALMQRLVVIRSEDGAGNHTLGDIWRRYRLSCPPREQIGQWLLDALDAETADYLQFHIQRIGCRYCQANFVDLQREAVEASQEKGTRRRHFFQTSVGRLPKK